MRLMPPAAAVAAASALFLSLAGCMSTEVAQVSKNFPQAAASGPALPAMQDVGVVAQSATRRPNAEIAEDFLDLEFRLESGRALPVLTRFEGPITLALTGAVPAQAAGEMTRLIARYRAEAGLDIAHAPAGQPASITVEFVSRSALQRAVPNAACFVVPGVQSFAEFRAASAATLDWSRLITRRHAAVFIPADTSAQEQRDCLNEETAQAMGPLNDLYHLTDSVFNDDNFNSVLTGFDMLMLRLHYAPELHSGMSRALSLIHI